MKRSIIALSLLAVLGLGACQAHGTGTWTPQSGDRTAGEGQVTTEKAVSHAATK